MLGAARAKLAALVGADECTCAAGGGARDARRYGLNPTEFHGNAIRRGGARGPGTRGGEGGEGASGAERNKREGKTTKNTAVRLNGKDNKDDRIAVFRREKSMVTAKRLVCIHFKRSYYGRRQKYTDYADDCLGCSRCGCLMGGL